MTDVMGIPAYAKAIAIQGLFKFPGVYALVNEGVFGFVEQLIQQDGGTLVSHQTAHSEVILRKDRGFSGQKQ
jgi:hypothetical protein